MSNDLIPNQILMLVTLVAGLICTYASNLPIIGGILSMILAVIAVIYGTNTLRYIGNYSLGTGVPSIVYLLTTVGLISYLLSLAISIQLTQPLLFPITGMVVATIFATIIALICKHVFGIQVEILTKSFISIALASTLVIMATSTLISQTYYPEIIYKNTIQNGLILLLWIMSVMAIQNPYNSCMGPNEDQIRTLSLASANIFLMLMITSVISILTTKYWVLYLVLSTCGWIISFRQYIIYTRHQAASIKRYGLWPKDDGEE